MSKKIFLTNLILLNCLLLNGCISQTVQPVEPGMLPSIVNKEESLTHHSLTKTEFLKLQPNYTQVALIKFEKTKTASVLETNQMILFPYNRITPSIDCSPLHACDIALQFGEKITGVFPGDSLRWLFEEAVSGEQQMHVIFKPKLIDISTNAIITTTKRTYHMQLNSKNMAKIKTVSFYYPDDFENEWNTLKREEMVSRQKNYQQEIFNRIEFNNQKLNFNYRMETNLLETKPSWMPVRVFNDEKHVYVQMPTEVQSTTLPALFIVGIDGQLKLVNYRVVKPYFIVDQLFKKAVLESGVGDNQQRVNIIYKG